MNTKFVLKSKTIGGVILVLIPLVCQLAGIEPPSESDLKQVTDALEVISQAVGSLLVVWGRFTSKDKLTLR